MTDPLRKWNQRLIDAVDVLFNANLVTANQHQRILKQIQARAMLTKKMPVKTEAKS